MEDQLNLENNLEHNFFQITIHSVKLSTFLNQLTKLTAKQEFKLKQVDHKIDGIATLLDNKIQKYQNITQNCLQNYRRKQEQQTNQINNQIRKIEADLREKNLNTQNQIKTLHSLIIKTKQTLEEDSIEKISTLKNYLSLNNQVEEQKKFLLQELYVKKINKMQENIAQFIKNFESYFQQNENKFVKNNSQLKKNKPTFIISRQKQKKNSINKEEEQMLGYASMTAKIQKLQEKFKSKEMESLNQVVYPHQKQYSIKFQNQNKNSQNETSKNKNNILPSHKFQSCQKQIVIKLENLEVIVRDKFQRLQQFNKRISQKEESIEDKVNLLNRRLEKQRNRIFQMNKHLNILGEKRMDEKQIENLKNKITVIDKNFQETVDSKISKQVYERQKNRINEKIHILHTNFTEKADKAEIKRALVFLEDKIKQIIILIADEQSDQRDGAIKKTALFKCLSCDKHLETQSIVKQKINMKQNVTGRCNTSKIRRKARKIVQNQIYQNLPNSQVGQWH